MKTGRYDSLFHFPNSWISNKHQIDNTWRHFCCPMFGMLHTPFCTLHSAPLQPSRWAISHSCLGVTKYKIWSRYINPIRILRSRFLARDGDHGDVKEIPPPSTPNPNAKWSEISSIPQVPSFPLICSLSASFLDSILHLCLISKWFLGS